MIRIATTLALALLLATTSGAIVHERADEGTPQGRAAADEGMLLYTVGRLTFEAPAAWRARGDGRHVVLTSPAEDARVDAQLSDRTFPDDTACLAHAEGLLAQRESSFTNVRRHPTTFAGRKAVVQEADQGGWHGWAWAVCDHGEQYRVFFTGRSPLGPEAVRASRLLGSSATLATPGPGA